MRKSNIKLVLFAVLINTILSAQAPLDTIFGKIDKEVVELMQEGDIPGLSIAVIRGEKTTIKSYGYSNLETGQKVTSKTLFELASCSKAFTALAIIDLFDKEGLKLKSYVSEYLPWFKVNYNGKSVKVSIENLLHHTSGIPWNTIANIPESNSMDALDKTVKILLNQELSNLPGEEFEYATINYDVLALILEKISGSSFESYMVENVFKKLTLENTSFDRPQSDSLMAKGYKISFFHPRRYEAPRYRGNNAAGYIITNASDISKWLKFQLELVESDLKPSIRATHVRDSTVPLHGMSSYGMGWEISLNGSNEIFHRGLNPNFSSHIILRPNEKIGVAVLANSNSSYTSIIADQTMKLLVGEDLEENISAGDNNDGFFSMLVIAFSIFIIVVILYVIWIFGNIFKAKRVFEGITIKKIVSLFLPIIVAIPLFVGLYLVPQATVGFNWDSILVWAPESANVLVKCLFTTWIVIYLAHIVEIFFPEKNKYKKGIPQIVLFSILSGLANVLVIIIVTSALDSTIELKFLIFYYVLVLLVYLLGRRFVQIKLTKITVSLVYDMRMKILSKVLQTSYQKLEKIESGKIFTVINDDTTTIGNSAGLFVGLVTSLITILGTFVYMFTISLWATTVIISVMLVLALVYYFVGQSANKYFEEVRDERSVFMGLIDGLIEGLKEISQHGKKKKEYKADLSCSAARFRDKNKIADVKFINGFLVGESFLLILLGFVSMGLSRLFPSISFYTLMSFVIVLLYVINPINSVLNSIPAIMRLKVSWRRIQLFLSEIPADLNIDTSLNEANLNKNIKKLIVRDVHFDYGKIDSGQTNFRLGPIDFEVNRGEVLFITGGNGSGKTTLGKVLSGLYKPQNGSIMVDNKTLTNAELSEYISTVFNPPYLFKKLYGIKTSGKEDIIKKLLKIFTLDGKVEIVDNQFSSLDLSSGQRKRLGLLQCYLEDSPIYLFDEWAADQDPEFRRFFYKTLIPEMKAMGKIVIAISHDDYYFDVADRIVQMREGRLKIMDTKKVILRS